MLSHRYILGTLFHYVVHKDEDSEKYRKRMKGLEAYGRARNLPLELCARLKKHFDFMGSKDELKQQKEIMDQLPPTLVAKIANWEHHDLINACQIFAGAPEQFLTMICCKLKAKFLMPGELLFKKGDVSRELAFIQSGAVDIFEDKDLRKILRSLSASVVGELSFFMGVMQPFTMAASENSDVILQSLNKEDYESILENYSEGHSYIASNLCLEYGLDRNGNEIDTFAAHANTNAPKAPKGDKVRSKGKRRDKKKGGAAKNDDADDWHELRKILQGTLKKRKDDALAAMIDAASEGDIEEVKRVLHQGLDVNTGDYDARTMLHLSAAEGNVKVVHALLQEGADVNVTDRWGQVPLHDATQGNHTQVIDLLASAGAELHFEDPAAKLCGAAAAGDIETLKALIDHGISPNAADYDGRTALHLAASEGIVNVIEFLLANKADINVLDRWNNTPLDDAVKHLHDLAARLLFEAGGTLNLHYASGALCEAASCGDLMLLRMLFENGTDICACDYDRRTALHLAAAEGQLVSIDFLLYAKADVNVQDRWGGTALGDALKQEYYNCAKLLIGAGGKVTNCTITAAQQEKLDAISLVEVRACVRDEVLKCDSRRRCRKQLKEQLKLVVSDLETNLVKFKRRAKMLLDLTGHLLHRGGHEALDAATTMGVDELFTLPEELNEERTTETHHIVPVPAPPSDSVSVESGGASSPSQKPASWILMRFLSEQRLVYDPSVAPQDISHEPPESSMAARTLGSPNSTHRPEPSVVMESTIGTNGDQINETIQLDNNTRANAGGNRVSVHASAAEKLVSFNQLILMFPKIERGFTMLRSEFDAMLSRTSFGKGIHGRDAATHQTLHGLISNKNDENSETASLSQKQLAYLIRSRLKIDATAANISEIILPNTPGGQAAEPPGKTPMDDSAQRSPYGHSLNAEPSTLLPPFDSKRSHDNESSNADEAGMRISFVQLLLSPVLHSLVATRADACRNNDVSGGAIMHIPVDVSGYHTLILAIDQCFTILNDAFNLLDRRRKGAITISELKQAIGGELSFGDELIDLFEGRGVIQRADFFVCFLYWMDVIDQTEFEAFGDDGDRIEDADALAITEKERQKNARVGDAEGDQEPASSGVRSRSAHTKKKRSFGTDTAAVFSAANEASASHPTLVSGACAWLHSVHFSVSFQLYEWYTQEPVEELWLRKVIDSGIDLHDGLEHFFRWIDADGSGHIGFEEFNTMLVRLQLPLPAHKVRRFFERFARANGNSFSFVEFTLAVHRISDAANRRGRDKVGVAAAAAITGGLDQLHGAFEGRWIVMPGRRMHNLWETSLLIASCYYTASVPYVFAFLRRELQNPDRIPANIIVPMYAFDSLLWINMIRKFFTAYVNRNSVTVTRLAKIRAHYFRTDFFFDLMAAIPVDLVVWFAQGERSRIAWLRLPRLLRARDIWYYLQSQMKDLRASHIRTELLKLFILVIVLLHVCACLWYGITHIDSNARTNNYLAASQYSEQRAYGSEEACRGKSPHWSCTLRVNEYMISLYWVTAVISTIGAGDLLPQDENERWFTMLLASLNLSFLAYVLGTISSLFMSADEELVATRREIISVERFISAKSIPEGLQAEIRAHFDFKADQTENGINEAEETDIFRSFSLTLQVEVAQHISRRPIQGTTCFRSCGENFLDMMSTQLHEVTASPGTVLFNMNDISKTLSLISSGTVELIIGSVATNNEEVEQILSDGDVVAPIPFFFNVRHTCTARTAQNQFVRMFILERESYRRLIKLYPGEEEIISRNVLEGESDDRKSASGGARSVRSGHSGKSIDFSNAGSGTVKSSEASSALTSSKSGKPEGSFSGSQMSGLTMAEDEQLNNITQAIEKARKKKDMERVCALCTAAAKGSLEELQSLAEGADISLDQGDYDLRTPFHLAASEGHVEIVKWLLKASSNMSTKVHCLP